MVNGLPAHDTLNEGLHISEKKGKNKKSSASDTYGKYDFPHWITWSQIASQCAELLLTIINNEKD